MSDWFRNPICCAVDRAELDDALALGRELADLVGGFKLGLEFFLKSGPDGVARMRDLGAPIFLDLKLHDIPATVAGAIRALSGLDVALLTLHAGGGLEMMQTAKRAVDEAPNPPKLVGVTVLTSLDNDNLFSLGLPWASPEAQALRLSELAHLAGLDGLVCSPLEAAKLRKAVGPAKLLVTPGVRPSSFAADDQKRIATPEAALRAGADILVIGRPISLAEDPRAAAAAILDDIAAHG